MVRLAEHNDWVIFIVLGAILVFITVLQYLQRESGLREFFTQNFIDSGNIFPTWLIVSVAYVVLFAAFFSYYIPVVPRFVEEFSWFGYSLNKLGFTLLAATFFYVVKIFLTFFFYSSIGQDKKWGRLYFVSSKFYMSLSILLIAANVVLYYSGGNRELLFEISLWSAAILFIFKNFFYAFNRNYILPDEWYYKILYICTLQLAPVLALWKLLFY